VSYARALSRVVLHRDESTVIRCRLERRADMALDTPRHGDWDPRAHTTGLIREGRYAGLIRKLGEAAPELKAEVRPATEDLPTHLYVYRPESPATGHVMVCDLIDREWRFRYPGGTQSRDIGPAEDLDRAVRDVAALLADRPSVADRRSAAPFRDVTDAGNRLV
jgi:hypothetical protein